ncbi:MULTISPECIES: M20 family metallopeptidase [Fusobacterium]|uniref:M20 metallopeptidase family protein n=1 Tax=Fusobacterium TaxID=848 RepID=UPI0014777100|nr:MULTISPECIES: M20 family metallopeptidase [Fusobacterium]NME35076.1 amidohydrolase [Fusobacterium sp. FSA-380-WT-3A]
MTIIDSAKEIQEYLQNVRRKLHENPDISNEEERTAAIIIEELKKLKNFKIHQNIGGYGIIADLEGENPGKTIALRADMDALQIEEETGLSFESKNKGIMHACGHDNHMTMVLGAAYLLSKRREELSGKVRFIFQPAEELPPNGGAKRMIKEGVLEGVDAIFGMHVWPDLPLGKIGIKEGPLMAASDRFWIKIKGKSSHAAKPNEGIDALVAGAQFVTAVQTIVSRNADPMKSIVITLGKMQSGTRYNIVPGECTLEGTCRTFSSELSELTKKRMNEILNGICLLSGCTGEIRYEKGNMAVINKKEMTEYMSDKIKELYGEEALVEVEPAMTAEDFSFYLNEIPGAFVWIGTTGEGEKVWPLHNSHYSPNEGVLWRGAALFAKLALDFNRR